MLVGTRLMTPAVILKDLMISPNKLASATHKKPHEPFICSKGVVAKVKLDFKKKSKPSSSSSSFVVDAAECLPSTSRGTGLPQPAKKSKIVTKPGDNCHCCGMSWKGSMIDFLKCVECEEWSCEECFEVERCVNCAE